MTLSKTKAGISPVPLDPLVGLREYIEKEADFNRYWADGRRGENVSDEYKAERFRLADERDSWCSAIDAAMAEIDLLKRILTCAESELISYRDEYTGQFGDEMLRKLLTPNA
jgi:hypothetical protein